MSKWKLLIAFFGVFFIFSNAQAELIILKSGKTVQGELLKEDKATITVRLELGDIQISRENVDRILSDNDADQWKTEKEKQDEPVIDTGMDLTIIDKDKPVVREKTLKEIGSTSQKFALENLVSFTPLDGNAAQYYWVVLDVDNFRMSEVVAMQGNQMHYTFSNPIFEKFRDGAKLKNCDFYPIYLPYPVGISPPRVRFMRIMRIGEGLIARGKKRTVNDDLEEGLRDMEAALVLGYHLAQNAPIESQYSFGKLIGIKAGDALAQYYLEQDNWDEYWKYTEYVKELERQLKDLKIRKEGLRHDFNTGTKVKHLMDYARHGENIILRAYSLNLLQMLRMAAEQPMKKGLFDQIPLESHSAFNQIAPGDGQRITALMKEIERTDDSDFMRGHATQLLTMNVLRLPQVAKQLLGR